MAAGFVVVQWNLNRQLDQQYEQRSLAVAESLASQPGLQQAVSAGDPAGEPARCGAEHGDGGHAQHGGGVRRGHQRPGHQALPPESPPIGTPIWYPDHEPALSEPFRTGKAWMGIQHGTLGIEATGISTFSHGKLIGEVSVGFLTTTVAGQAAKALPDLAAYFLAVLALGVLAALGLSRRLKRQTFGLELREIAALISTITAFKWVPTFARGFVRDIRVRWALEEAGQAYAVDCVDGVYVKSQAHRHFQPFGQIPTYRDDRWKFSNRARSSCTSAKPTVF